MRTKEVLFDKFEEIKIFQQYLYMSASNSITIHNSIGVQLRIRIDGDLNYWCKNLNFPNVPEANWTEEMSIRKTLEVIELLKQESPVEFPKVFDNRWTEIKAICIANLAHNKCM